MKMCASSSNQRHVCLNAIHYATLAHASLRALPRAAASILRAAPRAAPRVRAKAKAETLCAFIDTTDDGILTTDQV